MKRTSRARIPVACACTTECIDCIVQLAQQHARPSQLGVVDRGVRMDGNGSLQQHRRAQRIAHLEFRRTEQVKLGVVVLCSGFAVLNFRRLGNEWCRCTLLPMPRGKISHPGSNLAARVQRQFALCTRNCAGSGRARPVARFPDCDPRLLSGDTAVTRPIFFAGAFQPRAG